MSYPATSPYFNTPTVNGQYLDVMNPRYFVPDPTDKYWQITAAYSLRPDLLAHDLYNDSRLWWIFAQRNPNTLIDPLGDFVAGVWIYVPQLANVKAQLGF